MILPMTIVLISLSALIILFTLGVIFSRRPGPLSRLRYSLLHLWIKYCKPPYGRAESEEPECYAQPSFEQDYDHQLAELQDRYRRGEIDSFTYMEEFEALERWFDQEQSEYDGNS